MADVAFNALTAEEQKRFVRAVLNADPPQVMLDILAWAVGEPKSDTIQWSVIEDPTNWDARQVDPEIEAAGFEFVGEEFHHYNTEGQFVRVWKPKGDDHG